MQSRILWFSTELCSSLVLRGLWDPHSPFYRSRGPLRPHARASSTPPGSFKKVPCPALPTHAASRELVVSLRYSTYAEQFTASARVGTPLSIILLFIIYYLLIVRGKGKQKEAAFGTRLSHLLLNFENLEFDLVASIGLLRFLVWNWTHPLDLFSVSLEMNNLLTDSFDLPRGQPSRDGDIELGLGQQIYSADLGLEGFFKQVQEIDKQIENLSKLSKNLQVANEESKTVTKASAMKAIKHRMEKDIDEVGKIARSAKSKIEELDKDNLSNRQKSGCGKGSSVDRSRTTTTASLKKKLKERMADFQTLREEIHQDYREVVERRVFTVTGKRADEEEIDELIETGNSEQIFQQAIREQGRGQVMDTLAEIQERHDTVKDLERKLLDLQQVFLDLVVLVDAQGDILDNIESQVSNAVDHVQSGTVALQKAKKMQKSSRKWMCIAIIILLIIVAIIVLTVIKPWSSGK